MPGNRNSAPSPQEYELIQVASGIVDPDAYLIGKGFSSRAFKAGEQVVKLSRTDMDLTAATRRYDAMQSEYDGMSAYLSDFMLPTEFKIIPSAEDADTYRVASLQPFVKGSTIRKHIRQDGAELEPLIAFFSKALEMYDETKQIPDLGCIERGFNVLRDDNVSVSDEGQPTLLDDNSGNAQRSPTTGPFISYGISRGTKWGVRVLRRQRDKQLRDAA